MSEDTSRLTEDAARIAREACEALVAGDGDRFTEFLDPDVVMRGTVGGIDEERVMHGRDEVIDYLADIRDTWERFELEIERVVGRDDTAVVVWRETARTAQSDIPLTTEVAMVYRVRNSLIVEARGYLDEAAALEAAGLPA